MFSVRFAQVCFHRGLVCVKSVGKYPLALLHDRFHWIQVWAVRWKEDELESLLSAFDEALNEFPFVPLGVIEHDQNTTPTAQKLLKTSDEGSLVEFFAECIAEAPPSQKADRVELLVREIYLGDGADAPHTPASLAVRTDDYCKFVQAGYCEAAFSVLCQDLTDVFLKRSCARLSAL